MNERNSFRVRDIATVEQRESPRRSVIRVDAGSASVSSRALETNDPRCNEDDTHARKIVFFYPYGCSHRYVRLARAFRLPEDEPRRPNVADRASEDTARVSEDPTRVLRLARGSPSAAAVARSEAAADKAVASDARAPLETRTRTARAIPGKDTRARGDMVWTAWLRSRAHAYAPIVSRDDDDARVQAPRAKPHAAATVPLVLHHLHKPARRHDARKKNAATLLGAAFLLALLVCVGVALARARADDAEANAEALKREASRGTIERGGASFFSTRGFGAAAARAARDAFEAVRDVLSFKYVGGVSNISEANVPNDDTSRVFGFGRLGRYARFARRVFVAPTLQAFVAVAAFLSALVAADRMFHFYVAVYWRLVARKDPVREKWKTVALPPTHSVTSARADAVAHFPKVVVQLPMFNELSVCGDVIDKACALDWPRSRLLIQVLDDSTCLETRAVVDDKVFEWRERGVNVVARRRENRAGYKAGAMVDAEDDLRGRRDGRFGGRFYSRTGPTPTPRVRDVEPISKNPSREEGSSISKKNQDESVDERHDDEHENAGLDSGYEYAFIFDADFEPRSDFLRRVAPYLIANPEVGFVQARWTYVNGSESLLTRVQEISLNYHIRCEQFARHAAGVFFNFNGTAGAWRLTCVEDAGGWTPRTTVEDMDLSLRAYLRGWKFVFLDDVTCDCEIPAVYDAYRKQQHRWSCGPAQLFKIAAKAVWRSEKTPFAKKMYLIVFFFGTRMFASHLVSFALYCTLIPICATFPEVYIPFWALVYVPLTITISTTFWTRGGWRFAIPYVLCENAMSVVKVTAMFSGFLDWADANEWVVTRKLGRIIARKVDDARRSKSRAVAFVATRLTETRVAKDEDAAKPDGEFKKKKKRTGRSARWVFSSSRAPRTARSRTRCGSTPCS